MLIQSSSSVPQNGRTDACSNAQGHNFWGVSAGPFFWGRGMGGLTFDGTGLLGTGLFSGGLDLSTWTWAEYLATAVGIYVVYSVLSTTSRHARSVAGIPGNISARRAAAARRRRRAAELRKEAAQMDQGGFFR